MNIEKMPFFKGFQDKGTALVDVEAFESWVAAQEADEDAPERDETAYLLSSPIMRRRLLAALADDGSMTLEEVRRELGL